VAHEVLRQRGVESADDWLRRVVEDARQQLDPPLDVPQDAGVISAAIEGLGARDEEADHFVGLASYSLSALAGDASSRSACTRRCMPMRRCRPT
jgi:hypothetical protein